MPLQSENDRVINRCGPIFSPQLNGISTSFLALRLNLILYSLSISDKIEGPQNIPGQQQCASCSQHSRGVPTLTPVLHPGRDWQWGLRGCSSDGLGSCEQLVPPCCGEKLLLGLGVCKASADAALALKQGFSS